MLAFDPRRALQADEVIERAAYRLPKLMESIAVCGERPGLTGIRFIYHRMRLEGLEEFFTRWGEACRTIGFIFPRAAESGPSSRKAR